MALDCEAVAVARRPLAAERLDAIARRVALLGLAAKDAAEARRFVDVGARARVELDRFATAEDDDDDEAEAAFVEEADEADENAAWRPWARALHDATPTCGKRYWSSPRADTFPVRGANYLRDRIKVLNRGDAQFAPRPSTSCGTATPPASRRTTASGRGYMSAATRGTGSRSRGRPTRAATRSRWS